ncbi:transketolase [Elusimicrobiota bacterium]
MEIAELEKIGLGVRRDILEMLEQASSGHPGGSLSAVELTTALYFNKINFDPKNPKDPNRDYFILSKGHACPVLYSVLARFGCMKSEELCSLRQPGSRLQGHPAVDKKIPGIEVSTGSLGYGLSIGAGIALGLKAEKRKNRVYVLMGDGEQQEGSIWEAAMSAGNAKLDNLCGIVDYNKLQIDGPVEKVMNIEPISDKYKSFGWNVIEIDGHDLKKIIKAYDDAEKYKGKPSVIIAHTVKGKGVSFMENEVDWHGKAPKKEQLEMALKELAD